MVTIGLSNQAMDMALGCSHWLVAIFVVLAVSAHEE
jgi:hypothetical protein